MKLGFRVSVIFVKVGISEIKNWQFPNFRIPYCLNGWAPEAPVDRSSLDFRERPMIFGARVVKLTTFGRESHGIDDF